MQYDAGYPRLIHKTDGVLYAEGSGPHPPSVHYNGSTYYRFHDFIYVSKHIEDLNEHQVVAVCDLREQFATEKQLEPNRYVRNHFRRLVSKYAPSLLLEIGPGTRPLYPTSLATSFRYELVEIDPIAVRNLKQLGYSISMFNSGKSLALRDQSVSLAVAAFVFQFFISPAQIDEIARVLHYDGILVVNLYRRTVASRKDLIKHFEARGLATKVIRLNHGIGYNHEYWIIGQNLQNSKCIATIETLRRT